jgi:very-short-patch-repair endonuclease
MNFEIDGPAHSHATKRRFCAMRDRYLAQHGVVVKRINLVKYEKLRVLHELNRAEYAEAVMKGYRMRVDEELMKHGWQLSSVLESE